MAIYKILKDGEEVNTIVAGTDFVENYCAKNGFTFEEVVEPEPEETKPEPTTEEILNAMLGVSRYE